MRKLLPEYYAKRGWQNDGTIPDSKLYDLGMRHDSAVTMKHSG